MHKTYNSFPPHDDVASSQLLIPQFSCLMWRVIHPNFFFKKVKKCVFDLPSGAGIKTCYWPFQEYVVWCDQQQDSLLSAETEIRWLGKEEA